MRLMAVVMAYAAGERFNVAALCREEGVAPKTFYKWAARCKLEGPAGLEERSRRPRHSPRRTVAEVEDAVVRLRKELADAGLDHGATTIWWHLGGLRPGHEVPSVATIHRILVRRGLVVPTPNKRPKSAWRRFEASAPNEWWQIDAMDWVVATGAVKVFNVIDDHSRLLTRSRVVLEATSEQAWATFGQAVQQWGFPAGMLSDNGLCFSGKLRGFEVYFEARLRDAGVQPFTGRPYHPQTTGKVERFQQTLKRWLRRQPLAAGLDELQAQLDRFAGIYNYHRPHQGIGRVTPHSRWHASSPAQPASEPLPHPEHRTTALSLTVNATGNLRVEEFIINVGSQWAGCQASILIDATHATVLINGELVRHLKLDRRRRYQPSGRPRGGTRQPRHLTS